MNVDLQDMTSAEKARLIADIGLPGADLLSSLLELQTHSRRSFIDEETADLVAESCGMSHAKIYDVLSFYATLSPRPRGRHILEVCRCTPCHLSDNLAIVAILEDFLGVRMGETTPDGLFTLDWCPCVGACDEGPVMRIDGKVYGRLDRNRIEETLAYYREDPNHAAEPLYRSRVLGNEREPLLLRYVDHGDPFSVDDYRALGGYAGLERALTLDEDALFAEMDASGLLGRGGANYPAARRWASLRASLAHRDDKTCYVVCNADEGEPGMFKDREMLESAPLSIIEGMTIAALVFGAHQGYIYIRGEYHIIQKMFANALEHAREAGMLGEDICGRKGFSFDISVISGAGSYVCGENSALLESIEGKPSRPRNKPPYLTDKGLFGKPTLLHNAETLACVAALYRMGGETYHALGTPSDGGTRLVVFSGQAKNRGICEVRPGITLRELIYGEDFAGGTASGKPVKFFNLSGQVGSLGFPEHLDAVYSMEGLKQVGLAMGSGGFVIADEDACPVDYLRRLTEFLVDESCGRCIPCRIGTTRFLDILDALCSGRGKPGDVDRLEELAGQISRTAACGLASGLDKPTGSLIAHLRDEFEAHERGVCPTGVCEMGDER